MEAAREADVAIVVVGATDEVESEGFDRSDLSLPGRQGELVSRIAAANPNTAVAVNASAPVVMPWARDVPAVLWTWFGGQEYGGALADVLFGAAEPGGRLPTTFPASMESVPVLDTTPAADGRLPYDEGILVGYRNYDVNGIEPAFPFGHGLGYTTWEYEVVRVDRSSSLPDGDLTALVRVRNAGSRPGREVVQCYVEPASGATSDVLRRLIGFATVELSPGESTEVAVRLPWRVLAKFEPKHGWQAASGAYRLTVGCSSRNLMLEAQLEVMDKSGT